MVHPMTFAIENTQLMGLCYDRGSPNIFKLLPYVERCWRPTASVLMQIIHEHTTNIGCGVLGTALTLDMLERLLLCLLVNVVLKTESTQRMDGLLHGAVIQATLHLISGRFQYWN